MGPMRNPISIWGAFTGFFSFIGNPQNHCGTMVHVAGTNGKGSVCAMIANILVKAGYTTGLYTSPHLVSFRERIRVNGENDFRTGGGGGCEPHKKLCGGRPCPFFDVWDWSCNGLFCQLHGGCLSTGGWHGGPARHDQCYYSRSQRYHPGPLLIMWGNWVKI